MNISDYLSKTYESPPCWLLVSDVYVNELKTDLCEFKTITDSIREIANTFRIALYKNEHGFRKVGSPTDFTVVLMGKMEHRPPTHAGIYYAGGVLHATIKNGVIYETLSSISDQYKKIEFWQHGDN